MSGFLLLLVKVNLAMGAAIVLASLIRRPLRAQFGAPIAYAIWLLVPMASVASLLPPREVPAPAHVASVQAPSAAIPIMGAAADSALRAAEQLAGQSALMPPAPMEPPASTVGPFDISLLLFAGWVLGTLFMAAYLIRVQLRFSAAVRRGQAGPAVLGFFFPRVMTPDGFQEQFTPQEQAAIMAHESIHLARQDARINALVALLRCLCWFNPLIHLGARWLRIDQELACDAIAVSASVSRQTYARALLKSQLMVGVLPFGCNWPGPQHPLVERIALLQRNPPATLRRLAGMSLVLLTVTFAGLGAWAAQPPVATQSIAARQPGTALVAHMPAKAAPNTVMTTNAPVSTEQTPPPTTEGSAVALPMNQVAINQAMRQALQSNEAASADTTTRSPAAPPLPKEVSAPATITASSNPPATLVQPAPNAAPAVALDNKAVVPPAARDLPAGTVQAALRTPSPKLDMNAPYRIKECATASSGVSAGFVEGRVISSTAIQMPKVNCLGPGEGSFSEPGGSGGGGGVGGSPGVHFNSVARCSRQDFIRSSPWGPYCSNGPWATMNVQLANASDASKMPIGKVVALRGDFSVITQNNVQYWVVEKAKVLYADPFGR